ncbi:cyanophycinase [bacterium]|nr:cyanophycinase [bacterium]
MRAFSLFTLLLIFSDPTWASRKLLLIGGGDYPTETLKLMAKWAGGNRPKIMILSWATDDTEYSLEHLQESFSALGDEAPSEIIAPRYPGHEDYSKEEFLNALNEVGGVMMSGGDQVVLMERLKSEPEFLPALHAAYQRGVVFAGNSAGTAAASQTMLTGNGEFDVIKSGAVELAEGIGFLKNVIIDQHFIARKRQNRLISVLQTSTERMAFGIDEDCTLAIEDERKIKVIGPSMAMSFDNREARSKIVSHLLFPGETFDIALGTKISGEKGPHGTLPQP